MGMGVLGAARSVEDAGVVAGAGCLMRRGSGIFSPITSERSRSASRVSCAEGSSARGADAERLHGREHLLFDLHDRIDIALAKTHEGEVGRGADAVESVLGRASRQPRARCEIDHTGDGARLPRTDHEIEDLLGEALGGALAGTPIESALDLDDVRRPDLGVDPIFLTDGPLKHRAEGALRRREETGIDAIMQAVALSESAQQVDDEGDRDEGAEPEQEIEVLHACPPYIDPRRAGSGFGAAIPRPLSQARSNDHTIERTSGSASITPIACIS